jgi:hypothetical protein
MVPAPMLIHDVVTEAQPRRTIAESRATMESVPTRRSPQALGKAITVLEAIARDYEQMAMTAKAIDDTNQMVRKLSEKHQADRVAGIPASRIPLPGGSVFAVRLLSF